MKKVILRILFANTPHFLELILPEDEARNIMRDWRQESGSCAYVSGYDREQDRDYSFRSDAVAGMFTMDLESMKRQVEETRRQTQRGLPSVPNY